MDGFWFCKVCTLRNSVVHATCDACASDREPKETVGKGGSDNDTWICSVCTCINLNLLNECDACTAPRVLDVPPAKKEPTNTKGDGWVCVKCTFVNENVVLKCIVCEQGTNPAKQPPVNGPTVSVVKDGADTKVVPKEEEKEVKKEEKKVEQKKDEEMEYEDGEDETDETDEEEEEEQEEDVDEEMAEEKSQESGEEGEGDENVDEYADYEDAFADDAYHNMSETPYEVMVQNPAVIDNKKAFLPPVHELQALTVLNPMQTQALKHIVDASKALSNAAHSQLETRVKRLGYTPEQLQDTLRYIRDSAPIIIHVKLDMYLEKLLHDTHYRNQFETGTSGGTLSRVSRTDWENRMFNKIYANSSDFDRVKYGVLNITRDPSGVRTCANYGDSYFLLKNVRLRTTFASCDTSNVSVQISCCEYYEHVLATYTDPELSDLIAVATDPQGLMWKANIGNQYKEIQIHGPVELSKNIEAVVVNARFRGNKDINALLQKFATKNKCNILWMDELH